MLLIRSYLRTRTGCENCRQGEGSKGRRNSTHITAKLDISEQRWGEESPRFMRALHRPLLVKSLVLCFASTKA